MSEKDAVYSIQQTYIIKLVSKSEKSILTCDRRIDIPTIEPLTGVKAVVYSEKSSKIIPCIELAGRFLDEFELKFETNDGVTVLPVKIDYGRQEPRENPYTHLRYVLVLPRGATGVKSCKIIHKATGKEVQHNFTFGIMPPPYNYDNALFGYLSYGVDKNRKDISGLTKKVNSLKLSTKTPTFSTIDLPKGAGKQTINIEDGVLFYEVFFGYNSSSEPTTHKPEITLHGAGRDWIYTLSLNATTNTVLIDLFTGMLRVCDVSGEITQQFMLGLPHAGYETLSFENFDDINVPYLYVSPKGARVE